MMIYVDIAHPKTQQMKKPKTNRFSQSEVQWYETEKANVF